MKDVTGKVLEVGQKVVSTVTGYEELRVGTLIEFTPKKVKIRYNKGNYESTKFPYQVVVIEN